MPESRPSFEAPYVVSCYEGQARRVPDFVPREKPYLTWFDGHLFCRNLLAGRVGFSGCVTGPLSGMANEGVILLADDNPDDVLLVKRALRQSGAHNPLVIARNGEEVLQYLKGEGPFANREAHPLPGLILLDLDMPRVTGFQVLEWVRKQPELRPLPIIVLATSAYSPDIRLAYQLGANSFLTKPADPAELTRSLQQVLQFWFHQKTPEPDSLPPAGEAPDTPKSPSAT